MQKFRCATKAFRVPESLYHALGCSSLIIDFSPRMGVGYCREGSPGRNLLLVYAIVHSNPFIASQSGFGDFWIQVGKAWKQDHK
jgi:hypothetical protein